MQKCKYWRTVCVCVLCVIVRLFRWNWPCIQYEIIKHDKINAFNIRWNNKLYNQIVSNDMNAISSVDDSKSNSYGRSNATPSREQSNGWRMYGNTQIVTNSKSKWTFHENSDASLSQAVFPLRYSNYSMRLFTCQSTMFELHSELN